MILKALSFVEENNRTSLMNIIYKWITLKWRYFIITFE